jgi:hypothetical protein
MLDPICFEKGLMKNRTKEKGSIRNSVKTTKTDRPNLLQNLLSRPIFVATSHHEKNDAYKPKNWLAFCFAG